MPAIYTKGFLSKQHLTRHFRGHVIEKKEFYFKTEEEYLTAADQFLGSVQGKNILSYVRKCNRIGDVVKCSLITGEFGILDRDGFIRTYFKVNLKKAKYYFNNQKMKDEMIKNQ